MNPGGFDRLGACPDREGGCHFCVWAPEQAKVDVCLLDADRIEPLAADEFGYHLATIDQVPCGVRYYFRVDGGTWRPDPASRFQPDGVHGPSQVIDVEFDWTDRGWSGPAMSNYVIYELHVGTFTREGTLDAVIGHLDRLRDLGITAIELMPISQFPGSRNWGYDGVYPFAVQSSYGGPVALQRLVDACHGRGLAVILDVVYNHLGPEGNYLAEFGPYFSDTYRTPWGRAINVDGHFSDGVRRYFIENACQWIRDFHIDGLRLDAAHTILDRSPRHFLEELADDVHKLGSKLGRVVTVMAESDLNDPRFIEGAAKGGFGLDAMWCDDLHHAMHALLTGERNGYYADFGLVEHLGRAWERGMTFNGEYSVYRKRRHGRPIDELEPHQLVVFAQNHDLVGNRLRGERLGVTAGFESEKLSAGVALLSPYVPLLFMGQEYGETAPFQYFVSHGDAELVESVRRGRRAEFASFDWHGEFPDPQCESTFRRCVLNHDLRTKQPHAAMQQLYRQLLAIRKHLAVRQPDQTVVCEEQKWIFVHREPAAWMVYHFGDAEFLATVPVPPGQWFKAVDTADKKWHGPGSVLEDRVESAGEVRLRLSPRSFCVYTRAED